MCRLEFGYCILFVSCFLVIGYSYLTSIAWTGQPATASLAQSES